MLGPNLGSRILWETMTLSNLRRSFTLAGNSLFREWCKYRYGVFAEDGFPGGDRIYPHVYNEGNATRVSAGCEDKRGGPFCPAHEGYNRHAPTKQNLMCSETSAMETILSSEVNNRKLLYTSTGWFLRSDPRFCCLGFESFAMLLECHINSVLLPASLAELGKKLEHPKENQPNLGSDLTNHPVKRSLAFEKAKR